MGIHRKTEFSGRCEWQQTVRLSELFLEFCQIETEMNLFWSYFFVFRSHEMCIQDRIKCVIKCQFTYVECLRSQQWLLKCNQIIELRHFKKITNIEIHWNSIWSFEFSKIQTNLFDHLRNGRFCFLLLFWSVSFPKSGNKNAKWWPKCINNS